MYRDILTEKKTIQYPNGRIELTRGTTPTGINYVKEITRNDGDYKATLSQIRFDFKDLSNYFYKRAWVHNELSNMQFSKLEEKVQKDYL